MIVESSWKRISFAEVQTPCPTQLDFPCSYPPSAGSLRSSWSLGKIEPPSSPTKTLISSAGPFFTKAFDSNFEEGQQQRLGLPEDDPATVNGFIQWLYIGCYSLPDDREGFFELLVRLHTFADKVFAAGLKEDIIRFFFFLRCEDWVPELKTSQFLSRTTPEHSTLRSLMVN